MNHRFSLEFYCFASQHRPELNSTQMLMLVFDFIDFGTYCEPFRCFTGSRSRSIQFACISRRRSRSRVASSSSKNNEKPFKFYGAFSFSMQYNACKQHAGWAQSAIVCTLRRKRFNFSTASRSVARQIEIGAAKR